MLKVKKRFLTATAVLVASAFLVLVLRIGFPAHRVLAVVLYGLSLVTFLLSFRGKVALIRLNKKKVRTLKLHFVVGAVLLLFAYTARVLVPVEYTELLEYSDAELEQLITQDLQLIHYLDQADRPALGVETWPELRGQLIELDLLARRYKGFYQIDFLAKPVLHASAFLAGYSALQARARLGFDLVAQVDDATLEARLNEGREDLDIPEQSFFRIKRRLTHHDEWLRLHAGRAYLDMVEKHLSRHASLLPDLKKRYLELTNRLSKSPDLVLENPLEELERRAFKTWFPVQKGIALGMSHVRAWNDPAHITPALLLSVQKHLLPGDVLLERRSGYMTNLGIPGFWSHAALYIGSPEEFAAVHGEKAFEALNKAYPSVVDQWQKKDAQGYTRRVIEAKRPGVILTSLEDSAACDHLVVIRPRLSPAGKATAVKAALSHYGKRYDFNFDFATDGELVCSELVVKALLAGGDFPLALKTLNGRSMLPPHAMAVDAGKADGFFEVVGFYEKNPQGAVGERSPEDFLVSLKRPKWYGLKNR